jgi:hypothetical protein
VKIKHCVAYMAVLGSLCWFSMMVASQVETLTTPRARFLFLFSFLMATLAGVIGLCFLFAEAFQKAEPKIEPRETSRLEGCERGTGIVSRPAFEGISNKGEEINGSAI